MTLDTTSERRKTCYIADRSQGNTSSDGGTAVIAMVVRSSRITGVSLDTMKREKGGDAGDGFEWAEYYGLRWIEGNGSKG